MELYNLYFVSNLRKIKKSMEKVNLSMMHMKMVKGKWTEQQTMIDL